MFKQGKVIFLEDGGYVLYDGYFDKDIELIPGYSFKGGIDCAPRQDP